MLGEIDRRLIIATRNGAKATEMTRVLSKLLPRWELRTLAEFPECVEPEETGKTYLENAEMKAVAACACTRDTCIADDAGLEVDALGGEPGIHSKRFGGSELPFAEKIEALLMLLANVQPSARTARFRCAVVIASPGGALVGFESSVEGRIAESPRGSGGFGYDPIFIPLGSDRTFGEMSPDEKDAVSHRGKVLAQAAEYLALRGRSFMQ